MQEGKKKNKPYVHPDLVCHECSKKGHYLSGFLPTSEAAKAAIMTIKKGYFGRQKGVMDTNVESENTEKEEEVNDGIPTYEELK